MLSLWQKHLKVQYTVLSFAENQKVVDFKSF